MRLVGVFASLGRLLDMYPLCLDDAGSVGSKTDKHFVLSGICAFQRRTLIRRALAEGIRLRRQWALFGTVIEKTVISPSDSIEFAFEQVCTRLNGFLRRLPFSGNTQRGPIILDKSARETRLRGLAVEFKDAGHRYGGPKSIADVPLFVESKATRLIQYADLGSYALWQGLNQGLNTVILSLLMSLQTSSTGKAALFMGCVTRSTVREFATAHIVPHKENK